ncbi:MAG: hypothetical protein ACOCQX_03205 [Candidatus Nanoarchaeia archaeon]
MYKSIDYVVSSYGNSSLFPSYKPVSYFPVTYSPLENITSQYAAVSYPNPSEIETKLQYFKPEQDVYMPNVYVPEGNYFTRAKNVTDGVYFNPDVFLSESRSTGRFINSTNEVESMVREAFEKLTGSELDNVTIKVCSGEEMEKLHSNWSPCILGFSLNFGVGNMVFVLEDTLERLMVTIGHELGHVFTNALHNKHNEEAKAFAFQFAWVDTIKKNDIGGLQGSLKSGLPAENGLHNVAFSFVTDEIKNGADAMELHFEIAKGEKGL